MKQGKAGKFVKQGSAKNFDTQAGSRGKIGRCRTSAQAHVTAACDSRKVSYRYCRIDYKSTAGSYQAER